MTGGSQRGARGSAQYRLSARRSSPRAAHHGDLPSCARTGWRKAETAQRQGKQPDGSAKTREVKLLVAWTAQRRHPKTGIPMPDPDSVSYTAAIETAGSGDTDRAPPSPSAPAAKPNAAVSPMPTAGSSSATARPPSGDQQRLHTGTPPKGAVEGRTPPTVARPRRD